MTFSGYDSDAEADADPDGGPVTVVLTENAGSVERGLGNLRMRGSKANSSLY